MVLRFRRRDHDPTGIPVDVLPAGTCRTTAQPGTHRRREACLDVIRRSQEFDRRLIRQQAIVDCGKEDVVQSVFVTLDAEWAATDVERAGGKANKSPSQTLGTPTKQSVCFCLFKPKAIVV